MRYSFIALAVLVSATAVQAQDADRSVKGGVQVAGWKARVDRRPASQGKTVNDSKMVTEGGALRLSVGPAGNFWSDANVAQGDYTVKATFDELKMAASHPHSYGIFIGGHDLESDQETLMYCIAYGNGTYSIKTFHGEKVTTLVNTEASAALHKADAEGESKNEIGWSVKGGKASCVINGTTVKTLETSDVVAADKLTSLDGVYGIRVSHNLELKVSGLAMAKQ
ncbi:MAG: hypothetical protein ABI910_22870 [Gemmatimonadota bacterium]